jgi:lipopolysaccharide transport system ATP-binding protein
MISVVGEIGLAFRTPATSDDAAFRWDAPRSLFQGVLNRVRALVSPEPTPTVFHITHHKAGSQWINRIFHALAYDRLVLPERDDAQFRKRPIQSGKIYPTVYVTRDQFHHVAIPRNSRRFVVIRDLRDTLVSGYFSIKHSHDMDAEGDLRLRDRMSTASEEDGLLEILDSWLPARAAVQESWLDGPDDLIKYEDLLARDEEILARVLIGHCKLKVTPARLREVVRANSFQARSGREPGAEDIHSHERKGIAGDWRNHFTPRVKAAFKARFAKLLIATGYERGSDW